MLNSDTIVGGRYKVVKPLGGGGMKLVYLAEDLRLAARRCALAEMVDSFTNPEMQSQAVAAFQREADMLAQLSNEHIPRVYDRFSEQNHHYLVMEYIEGVTLEEALKVEGGKLAEDRIIDIALQILDTLIYLHGLSPAVVYRDLKPSNVMVTPSGQAKLIDFGIARFFQPQRNATMIGTQGYAPPEQYRGKAETRSDLYALGATMHHALSGRDPTLEPPFSFPPLRKAFPGVTAALAEVVDLALAYDVAQRIPDAREFKRRLIEIKMGVAGASWVASAPKAPPPLNHPDAGYTPSPPMSSAPTILSSPSEIMCPGCGSHVPADSKFCSFCAADLRRVLGPADLVNEAETVVLSERHALPPEDRDRRNYQRTRRRHRFPFWVPIAAAGFFFVKYAVPRLAELASQQREEASAPPYHPPAPVPAPEAVEPEHVTPREIMLRRLLDAQGYRAVHFRVDGGTIVLWGTVPNDAHRAIVQTLAWGVMGLPSLEDHLQAQSSEFGFDDPG